MSTTSENLFEKWRQHASLDFHYFTNDEALEIRQKLLKWYDGNRRKLPWRGDPAPWDGSTAKAKKTTSSKPLTDFFRKKTDDGHPASKEPKQFPVTAYGVWVSEIMCQQTRIEAVIPYWTKWMVRFPTPQDLADASEDDVNAHWAGLGFYRRARLLHEGARQYVLLDHEPTTAAAWQQLPGVGPYTAAAIASIVYDEAVPVVDGNVCRVLARLRGIAQHIKAPVMKDKHAWTLAAQIVQADEGTRAGCVNQALMELGATWCAPSGTGIDDQDPLKDYYWSTRLGQEYWELHRTSNEAIQMPETTTCPVCAPGGLAEVVEMLDQEFAAVTANGVMSACHTRQCGHRVFPLAPPKAAKREEVLAVAALSLIDPNGSERWLLVKRPKDGLLAGQLEFPAALLWNSDDAQSSEGNKKQKRKDMSDQLPDIDADRRRSSLDKLLDQLLVDAHRDFLSHMKRKYLAKGSIEHIFSHVRHTMHVEHAQSAEPRDGPFEWQDSAGREVRWMSEDEMKQVGVTSGVRKVLKAVKSCRAASAKGKTAFNTKRAKKTL